MGVLQIVLWILRTASRKQFEMRDSKVYFTLSAERTLTAAETVGEDAASEVNSEAAFNTWSPGLIFILVNSVFYIFCILIRQLQ